MSSYQNNDDAIMAQVALPSGMEKVGRESADWGYPGFLTVEEVDVFMKLRRIIEERNDKDLFETAYLSFGEIEERNFALCRWLRARKYDLANTLKMIEEATEMKKIPKRDGFYPDANEALGCPKSVYLTQYPQMYVGFSKLGHPVYISKPGMLNVDGLECITSIQRILNYHWHDMHHNFGRVLEASSNMSSDYKRFECVCIIDLEHLSPAQITKRALNIIKIQTQVDSLCYPETLNKMIIINAPNFFTLTWKIIRKWVDIRTANKVELYNSSKRKWQKRLGELIPLDQLPADYGGTAESFTQIMEESSRNDSEGVIREKVTLLSVRGSANTTITLAQGEALNVTIYTRSNCKSIVSIQNSDQKVLDQKSIQHNGPGGKEEENCMPTHEKLHYSGNISGKVTIHIRSQQSSFHSSKYVVVARVIRGLEGRKSIEDTYEDNCVQSNAPISPTRIKRMTQVSPLPDGHAYGEKRSRHSNVVYLSSPTFDQSPEKLQERIRWNCGVNIPAFPTLF